MRRNRIPALVSGQGVRTRRGTRKLPWLMILWFARASQNTTWYPIPGDDAIHLDLDVWPAVKTSRDRVDGPSLRVSNHEMISYW